MKKSLTNKFILILILILMIMTTYTLNRYIYAKEKKEKNIETVQLEEEKINLITKEMLIKTLNDENKMLVLSGETEIKVIYSNKDIDEEDVGFRWVKEWLSEANSKDLSVVAVYKYQFHYDLIDLPLELNNDIAEIYLSKNRISCQVELIENKTLYVDRVGIFETRFTPEQINSLNGRTKDLVLNKIQADKELRETAIANVRKNIKSLLPVKSNFKTSDFDVLEDNNKNIIKIN